MRRPDTRTSLLWAGCLVAAAVAGAPAEAAKDPQSELKGIERQIEKDRARAADLEQDAAALEAEVIRLRGELVDAARRTQALETTLTELENDLTALIGQEVVKQGLLLERRDQLQSTLAALERLAVYPPEAMIARPERANDTVRGALLLRALIPRVEAQAAALVDELESLADLRRQVATRREDMEGTVAALADEQAKLSGLLEKKQALQKQTGAEREKVEQRLSKLANQAGDMRDLLVRLEAVRRLEERRRREEAERRAAEARRQAEEARRLEELARKQAEAEQQAEAERQAAEARRAADEAQRAVKEDERRTETASLAPLRPPEGLRPFSTAHGQIVTPIAGRVVQGFKNGRGLMENGVVIEGREGAQVVAPYDGRVVFAGPFRGYGRILIIEHGGGYHSLIAGLQRVDGVVNQWLLAGEPIGVLGRSESGSATLYLEIRLNSRPIDPAPWLALNQSKASG